MRAINGLYGVMAVLLLVAMSNEVAAQQRAGCWHTAKEARDYRQICVMPDFKIHITTFRTGTGSRCDAYPVANGRVAGDKLSFQVRPGSGNCHLPSGSTVNSVQGTFNCEFKGTDRLVCTTAWEGWEPIQETYMRR